MRKGKLLYETPGDSLERRILSLSILTVGLIIAVWIAASTASLQHAIIIFVLVMIAFMIFSTEPTVSHPILHKKIRVYENGITYPSNRLRSLFSRRNEGPLVPFDHILGFDKGETVRRVFVYFKKGTKNPSMVMHLLDDRYGVLDPICDIFESIGIPEVGLECPTCGNTRYRLYETCTKCGSSRFSVIDDTAYPFHCEVCGSILHYFTEHESR